jgi:hypothetical protein
MAEKRKRGRPPGAEKTAMLSVRISAAVRRQLEVAARKVRRRLSREVESRLAYTLGRYGTDRPAHVRDLAELTALLAEEVERETGGTWDRKPLTRERLVKAFAQMVDLYSNAEVTLPSVSFPASKADFERERDDPATAAVRKVVFSLLHSIPPHGWEPEDWSPGGAVRFKVLRNFEKRRRKK